MKLSKTYNEFISEKKSKKKSPKDQIKDLSKKQKGLIDKARDIKEQLTDADSVTYELQLEDMTVSGEISKSDFDGLIGELVKNTLRSCRRPRAWRLWYPTGDTSRCHRVWQPDSR